MGRMRVQGPGLPGRPGRWLRVGSLATTMVVAAVATPSSLLHADATAQVDAVAVPVQQAAARSSAAYRSSSSALPPASSSVSARSSALIEPADTLDLTGLEARFQRVADRVAKSVVAISTSINPVDSDEAVRSDQLNGERLEAILDRATRTVGTGMVIDADGYILTNEHVVAEASNLWVTLDSGRVYPALVVGSDPRADLAVLKVPASGLEPVDVEPPESLRRGQWTIALGNPYGLATEGEMCMSVGVISALDRSLPKLASKENRLYANLVQTTAQINPGNSGGPLFNLAGRVIGINTAVILPQKQTNGIGFAMPFTPELIEKVRALKEGREVIYAYLGVMVSTPTPRDLRGAGLDPSQAGMLGARVDTVEAGSPAEGGLRPGDVVLKIGDTPVTDSEQFVRLIGRGRVDAATPFVVRRDGKTTSVAVQLRKRQLPGMAVHRSTSRMRWKGMLLGAVPGNWLTAAAKPAGGVATLQMDDAAEPTADGVVVLGIEPTSPYADHGVTAGSVITAVAGQRVRDLADLQRILDATPAEPCAIETAPVRQALPRSVVATTTP